MTNSVLSSPLDSMTVLISHRRIPVTYLLREPLLNKDENAPPEPVFRCQITSNAFLYATLLGQLTSSVSFAHRFYQLLNQCFSNSSTNRQPFRPVFLSVSSQHDSIHLKASDLLKQYDEWINRRWASIQLHLLTKRIRFESSWAWLSTLGGGHSCLGEVLVRHALDAEVISKNQIALSTDIGDPNALVKSYLFLALSYLQQKRYDEVRIILRFQYFRIQQKDITEERLPIMCRALWRKMKYAIKRAKQN